MYLKLSIYIEIGIMDYAITLFAGVIFVVVIALLKLKQDGKI